MTGSGERPTRGVRRRRGAPELVIEDREELLFLLGEAAELEHAICCCYLFAAFSLRSGPEDGLTGEELVKVRRWRRTINHVALQEMVHLAMVNNVLAAVGGAPHLGRAAFPQWLGYAPEITLALAPFEQDTLERFLYIERPEGVDISDVAGAVRRTGPTLRPADEPPVVAVPQEFDGLGGLYRGLERGLAHLADRYGEAAVFVGSRRTQSSASLFAFPAQVPELVPVTDLASAREVLNVIVEEGEGARGDRSTAHYGRFLAMLSELRGMQERNPSFSPARPVAENPYVRDARDLLRTRPPAYARHGLTISLIDDPAAVRVSDLFDACYAVLLRMLERLFNHGEETTAELRLVADAAVEAMWSVIRPLGELLTRLPAGPSLPGRTAGPGFRLDGWTPVTAHKRAAWVILSERLGELAEVAERLADVSPATMPAVAATLRALAARFAPATGAHRT